MIGDGPQNALAGGEETEWAQVAAVCAQRGWLRHHWGLAAELGVLPHLARSRAALWAERCPDADAALAEASPQARQDHSLLCRCCCR